MHIHGRIEKGLISFLVIIILFQAVASIDLRWPKATFNFKVFYKALLRPAAPPRFPSFPPYSY